MLVALFVMCALRPVLCYSNGAPLSSCKEMVPRHRTGPTYTHHNFQLLVDTGVLEGRLTVRLLTLNQSVKFRGFLIRAMALKGNSWVYLRGLFEKDAKFQDSLYLDCEGQERNAVTHGDNKGKVEVVVHWRPDPSPRYLIQVMFRATVVQTHDLSFLKVDSRALLLGAAEPAVMSRRRLTYVNLQRVACAAVWFFYFSWAA
ncbi:putative defense protein Hdd11-like [Rhipicephalus microplus]|uniref:putative defense protein Hdd11-like n=1 Tax=Rhipicephalus microplus TaxID=6941 RepID=UPI003F6BF70C